MEMIALPPAGADETPTPGRADVLVCGGTGCHSSNAQGVLAALDAEVNRRGLAGEVRVLPTGCRGFCAQGPVVIVHPDGLLYCQVKPEDVAELVEETLVKGRVVKRLAYKEPSGHQALPRYEDIPFYRKQVRIALRNCGLIDPESIDEYIARDGYAGAGQGADRHDPGRCAGGDEGFRAARSRRRGLPDRPQVGVRPALRGEAQVRHLQRRRRRPGRVHGPLDPGRRPARGGRGHDHRRLRHRARATATSTAAPSTRWRSSALQMAIAQAHEYGLLGENILGSGFDFELHVKEGAGAFVCGEETALMASIEGRRGEPRPRPPFPAVPGLWAKPSNVNNVKSYGMTPQIMLRGADWFRSIGTEGSPGTAVFALTGKINNTGLIEVPMGITLRRDHLRRRRRHAQGQDVQGRADGRPAGRLSAGIRAGHAGGLRFADCSGRDDGFGRHDRRGRDPPAWWSSPSTSWSSPRRNRAGSACRVASVGNGLLELLTRISEGHGKPEDLDEIERISLNMKEASLCMLGQLTPGPVMSALRFFRRGA